MSELSKITGGRVIAFDTALVGPLGSINAALLFSQLFYWKDKAQSPRGVHKSRDEIQAETGLKRTQQENARKVLESHGLITVTRDYLKHRVYFKINEDKLYALLGREQTRQEVETGVDRAVATVETAIESANTVVPVIEDEAEFEPACGYSRDEPFEFDATPDVEPVIAQAVADVQKTEDDAGETAVAEIEPIQQIETPSSSAQKNEHWIANDAWDIFPKRTGNTAIAFYRLWCERVAAGISENALFQGIKAYAAYCRAKQIPPRSVMLLTEFLGPRCHFLKDWGTA
ncbi:hypothetical protein [Paraburkholderia aspalathi]|uniref:hypothetical protein n=1 Tax=Paraburkholderia aspalathi TaxID=1324617 RepID=UPI0038BD2D2A